MGKLIAFFIIAFIIGFLFNQIYKLGMANKITEPKTEKPENIDERIRVLKEDIKKITEEYSTDIENLKKKLEPLESELKRFEELRKKL